MLVIRLFIAIYGLLPSLDTRSGIWLVLRTMPNKITSCQRNKQKQLESILRDAVSAVVAFSGGVDSALLTFMTHRQLGNNMVAVTARSSTYPEFQFNDALDFVSRREIPHVVIDSEELDIPNFSANPPDRCYFCKYELFSKLREIADDKGYQWVFDGTNTDDFSDYRPGSRAAKELGVRSPLAEAKLNKKDIRAISKHLSLPTWDLPAYACLASRFPYGEQINRERLAQIEQAEEAIRTMGFSQFRVRFHGEIARIEIAPEEMPRALSKEMLRKMSEQVKKAGFAYATLDLDGYRRGSMNETLKRIITDSQ